MIGVELLRDIDAKTSEIQSVVDSLNKRRKSIKNRVHSLAFERVIERDENGELEKLEVALRTRKATNSPSFRLHVWSDRWVWVDARLGGKSGWEWEWQCEGRCHGDNIGKSLVSSIEKSISIVAITDTDNIAGGLDKVWASLLAQGPKEVAS